MSTTEFELEGTRFTVGSLGIDEACAGLELFGLVAGPAIAAALLKKEGESETNLGALIQAALLNASKLAKLLRMFAKGAKFDRLKDGRMVALEPFIDDVFGGRLELLLAFLAPCVRAEFGSFLSGGGLESLLKQAGFGSPPAVTA